ncbi:MAG TPA: A24 family peptidase [Rhodoblastus sp.]|mgnify:CR=1 FL=1|nr:A24 family peptidase [Rhodoblastus sp.]
MSGDGARFEPASFTPRTLAALAVGCAASLFAAPGLPGLFGAALFVLALSVAIVDWRDLIIPDWMNTAIFALALAQAAASADADARLSALGEALLRGAALGGVLLLVRLVYRAARGHDGLGLGDVKLGFAGGAWIGWTLLPVAIEIAALSALAVFLVAPRLSGRAPQWGERLPFGSFLAPAIWATWLIGALMER